MVNNIKLCLKIKNCYTTMVYFVVVTVGEDSQDMDKRMEYYLVQKWKCKYFNMEGFSGMYVPGY